MDKSWAFKKPVQRMTVAEMRMLVGWVEICSEIEQEMNA